MNIFTLSEDYRPLDLAVRQGMEDDGGLSLPTFVSVFSTEEVAELQSQSPSFLKPVIVTRLTSLGFTAADRIYPFGPPTLAIAFVVAAFDFYATELRIVPTNNPFSQIIVAKAVAGIGE